MSISEKILSNMPKDDDLHQMQILPVLDLYIVNLRLFSSPVLVIEKNRKCNFVDAQKKNMVLIMEFFSPKHIRSMAEWPCGCFMQAFISLTGYYLFISTARFCEENRENT